MDSCKQKILARNILLFILFSTLLLCFVNKIQAACTVTIDSSRPYELEEKGIVKAVTIPIHVQCTTAASAITDYELDIPTSYRGMQLRDVEITPGSSTCSVFIENGNDIDGETTTDVVGTPIWYLSAINTTNDETLGTPNRMYGGHIKWGVFPTFDSKWFLTLGTMEDTDDFYIRLHLRSGD